MLEEQQQIVCQLCGCFECVCVFVESVQSGNTLSIVFLTIAFRLDLFLSDTGGKAVLWEGGILGQRSLSGIKFGALEQGTLTYNLQLAAAVLSR